MCLQKHKSSVRWFWTIAEDTHPSIISRYLLPSHIWVHIWECGWSREKSKVELKTLIKDKQWIVNLKSVAREPSLNGRSHSRLALTAGSAGVSLTFCLSFANSSKIKLLLLVNHLLCWILLAIRILQLSFVYKTWEFENNRQGEKALRPTRISFQKTDKGRGRQGVSSFDNRDNTCKNTWSHKCRYHLRNLIQAFSKILKLAKGRGFLTVCHCKVLHWVCTYTYICFLSGIPSQGPDII